MQDGSHSISIEMLDISSQHIWYTEGTVEDEDQVQSWRPWPCFQGEAKVQSPRPWPFFKVTNVIWNGFPLISDEVIFDKLSPDLVHRITRAKWRPNLNFVPLVLLSRSWRSFEMVTYARWFPLNICRIILQIYRSTGARQRPSLNRMTFTLFQGHKGDSKWFPLKIWRYIWHILTKFCTKEHWKHLGRTNTKLKPCDLDLIFKVTTVI